MTVNTEAAVTNAANATTALLGTTAIAMLRGTMALVEEVEEAVRNTVTTVLLGMNVPRVKTTVAAAAEEEVVVVAVVETGAVVVAEEVDAMTMVVALAVVDPAADEAATVAAARPSAALLLPTTQFRSPSASAPRPDGMFMPQATSSTRRNKPRQQAYSTCLARTAWPSRHPSPRSLACHRVWLWVWVPARTSHVRAVGCTLAALRLKSRRTT